MNNRIKEFSLIVMSCLLLFGVALTIYGFGKLSSPVLPWEGMALRTFYGFFFLVFILIFCLTKFLKNVPLSSLIVIVLCSIISSRVWELCVVIWIIISSIVLGRIIANQIRLNANWLTCFFIGSGVLGTTIGLAAHFPINYPSVYMTTLVLLCLLGRKVVKDALDDVHIWYKNYKLPTSCLNKYLEIFVFTIVLIYFVVALLPETGYDALGMHLFIPAKLSMTHVWEYDVNKYTWSVMPMLGDWVFSLAYMLGGETSARLINLYFIYTLALLLKRIGSWASNSDSISYIICGIFLSCALTHCIANTLSVESVWSTFLVASIFELLTIQRSGLVENNGNKIVLAGLFVGFAVAGKLLAVTAIPLLLVMFIIIIMFIINYQSALKKRFIYYALLGCISFVSVGCIPYLTAFILTKNPVFPFYNKIFHSPFWEYENFKDVRWNSTIDINFLYNLTFETGKYLDAVAGAAGFQWLIFFPLCLIILIISFNKRGLLLTVISLTLVGITFNSIVYLRYVFPAYAILCVVIGIGLAETEKISKGFFLIIKLVLIGVMVLNVTFLSSAYFVYQDFPIQALLNEKSREDYIRKAVPIRKVIQITNLLNNRQRSVAIFSNPFGAQIDSDVLYFHWYNQRWYQSFQNVKNKEELFGVLSENKVEYIILEEEFLPKEKNLLLEETTEKVTQISHIQLRKVKKEGQFTKELLINASLKSKEGWAVPAENLYNQPSNTVIVTEQSPTIQRVQVTSDTSYIAQVSSRCLTESTQGRVQINWLDNQGQFIKSDIKLFNCTNNWNTSSNEVVAPSTASYADFYLTSHNNIKIEINSASFKE